MNRDALIRLWKEEEEAAHICGWDFSHIAECHEEVGALSWDYREEILARLRPQMRILDMDTGGGEFLLSLGHPWENTAATENYAPNVALCRERLLPLGVDFRQAAGSGYLPFEANTFDLVLNRHGDFDPEQIFRVLKPGGLFITQQVGAENDRELVELLCGAAPLPFPEQYPGPVAERFRRAGFRILDCRESFRPIRFYDVGALVWFARIISWEFIGFSVERDLDRLFCAQAQLEQTGCLSANTHRFFLIAEKQKNL